MVLAVRPENIAVRPLGEDGETRELGPNACRAVVRDKIYLGVEFRLMAALVNGAIVQVRSRNLKEMDGFARGSAIELSWKPEDTVVLRG